MILSYILMMRKNLINLKKRGIEGRGKKARWRFLLKSRRDYFDFFSFFFFWTLFIYFYRERGMEGERERNIIVWLPLMCPLLGSWPATQACALTGNQTGDLLLCSLVLNPLSHPSQGKY